ncbi:hypothetical protein RRG08_014845 [Elysia crispata]|uniref:Uncharacterized protein n=1 Tax=Elysia crispata TaxID=231223 RepID=A0AAE0Z5A5_9GAST|nr:hypothetical protein RRG08_014845 [Elysia crispata]
MVQSRISRLATTERERADMSASDLNLVTSLPTQAFIRDTAAAPRLMVQHPPSYISGPDRFDYPDFVSL